MAIESIDNVLEQLVLSGSPKLDAQAGETNVFTDGRWQIGDHKDHGLFEEHIGSTIAARMQELLIEIKVDDPHDDLQTLTQLLVHFDPVTRRIEAMEVWDITYETTVLTLMFWPGLESARKLVISAMAHWQQVIADGWFEGVE